MTWSGSPEGLADSLRQTMPDSAPIDVDAACVALGAGIDIDCDLPGIPAIRDGDAIRVRPGLSRPVERWFVLHELGHVALGSLDVDHLRRLGRAATLDDERRATRFGAALAVPAWDLIERLEHGEAMQDLALEYGLTAEHLSIVARAAYDRVRDPFAG